MAPRLHTILASTRPGRIGHMIAQWVNDFAREHGKFDAHLIETRRLLATRATQKKERVMNFGFVGRDMRAIQAISVPRESARRIEFVDLRKRNDRWVDRRTKKIGAQHAAMHPGRGLDRDHPLGRNAAPIRD